MRPLLHDPALPRDEDRVGGANRRQTRQPADRDQRTNAFSYSMYRVIAKPLAMRYPPLVLIAWVFALSTWTVPFFARDASFVPPPADCDAWLSLAYVLVFPTMLAYLLNCRAGARGGVDHGLLHLPATVHRRRGRLDRARRDARCDVCVGREPRARRAVVCGAAAGAARSDVRSEAIGRWVPCRAGRGFRLVVCVLEQHPAHPACCPLTGGHPHGTLLAQWRPRWRHAS